MLLNWFVSSVADTNSLKQTVNTQDLKNLGVQYCTDLLAAGVLRQISDKNAPLENVFKVCIKISFLKQFPKKYTLATKSILK